MVLLKIDSLLCTKLSPKPEVETHLTFRLDFDYPF